MNPPPKDGCISSFPTTCRMGLKGSTMKKTTKKSSKEKTSSSKTATKTSKAKSPSVSKYFQKNNEQDKKESENQATSGTPPKNNKKVDSKNIFNNSASDDDFRSPMILRKRKNLAWKLNKDPKEQKTTPKKRKNKKVKTRNSTIQVIQENFKNTEANPDHLQMAIALSKSTYEAEHGHSFDAVSKEETPNISQILQNAKTTNLERFGFKSDKCTLNVETRRIRMASSEQTKRTKNRFKYITPTLNLRSTEDRESLIVSKMSLILNQPQPTPKEPVECSPLCSKIRDFHSKNRSVFRLDRIYESNCFYVDTWRLPKNTYKCSCLLKDFNSIPGRDESPKRHDRNLSKSISDEESTSEKCSKPIWMSDNKDSGFTSFGTCTTSSSYRCVSPDLFGSDDDQYNEDLDLDSIEAQLEKSNETVDLTDEDINKSNSSNSCIRPASFYSLDEFEMKEVDVNMETKCTNEEKFIINGDSIGDLPLNNHIGSNSFDGKLQGSSDNVCSAENPNHEDEINVNSSHRMSSPSSPWADHNKSLPKNEPSLECIEISDESSLDHHCEDLNIPSPSHSLESCLTAKPATNESFSTNDSLKDLQPFDCKSVSSNIDNNLESPKSQSCSWVDPNEQSLKSIDILDEDHHCEDVNVSSPHSSERCDIEQNHLIDRENIHKPATNLSFSSNESLNDLQSNKANVRSNINNSLESPISEIMDYLSSSWVEPNEQFMESIEILDHSHSSEMQENIHSPCTRGLDTISRHKYLTNEEENIGSSDQIKIPSISPPSNNLETLNGSLSDIHYESVPTQSPVFDDDHAESDREHSLNNSDGSTHKTERGPVNSSLEDTPKISSARNSDMYNSAHLNVTDYVNQLLSQDDFGFDSNFCEENVSLSQSSQSSVVDEELNYSSHFATPGKFQYQTPMSPDLVILDELGDELNELPVPSKNTSPLSTPLKPPLENTEITTKKSDNYIIKAKNVTPMPDYDTLTTPLIKKELEKIGVKPIKRARGVKLLQYIYNSTHPLVGSVEVLDSEDDSRVIKRRKISCEVISPESSFKSISSIEIIGDQIIENEKPEDLIFERRLPKKIPTCQVPLQIIWHNFLSCNPDIKENILLYEPLQLESLHMMLKEQGFKFHVQDLLTFLDKKCITIRTAQKQGKRHR